MAPLRGWAPKGERRISRAPYGHRNTMTFIAALRQDRIDAPFLLDGPMNQFGFQAYIEQLLAPPLKPGDLVMADNLPFHKRREVRAALRAVGTRLFLLPKYSPDLNPIEQVFAKLKHLLRKAQARSRDAVCETIGQLLESNTAKGCANYLAHSGYDGRNVIPL